MGSNAACDDIHMRPAADGSCVWKCRTRRYFKLVITGQHKIYPAAKHQIIGLTPVAHDRQPVNRAASNKPEAWILSLLTECHRRQSGSLGAPDFASPHVDTGSGALAHTAFLAPGAGHFSRLQATWESESVSSELGTTYNFSLGNTTPAQRLRNDSKAQARELQSW